MQYFIQLLELIMRILKEMRPGGEVAEVETKNLISVYIWVVIG